MPTTVDHDSAAAIEGTVLRFGRFSIHDGPGIRTTVFFKGCPLRCAWCHSPESQDPRPEFMPRPERCIRCGACTAACPHGVAPAATAAEVAPAGCQTCGACAEACPSGARDLVGRRMCVPDLMALVERDRIFYDESGGGVTFSGGEPLLQAAFLVQCVRACRAARIGVAVDTCGFGDSEALLEVARDTDLFLFDLKTVNEGVHAAYTGASNRGILENLARLSAVHPRIVVRFPVIPGVNTDDESVRDIAALLLSLGLTRIDVLPYHRAGLAKYHRLRRPYVLEPLAPPDATLQEHVAALLESSGLIVRPGGSS